MRLGGEVISVIPSPLAPREISGPMIQPERVRVVRTMHERKALIARLADGFIALPGGFGTFDELHEAAGWSQLGIHRRVLGLLDTRGFYGGLLSFWRRAVREGFIAEAYLGATVVHRDPAVLVDKVLGTAPPKGFIDKEVWDRAAARL